MNKKLTLGSLFDGSGGFPLGGTICGIEPIWLSEIEPFPIRVTMKHFPNAEHLGDINKINGDEIPPVDIITGGFPCQNLSIAGARDGLRGDRSSLFFQMVRIIKEMRKATNSEYPKYIVIENVPGMYSSNKSRDFLEVLNELIKIKDETLSVPMPEKGKWANAGEIVGSSFSLSWRTLDAQYWGVSQRRRRCYLVVDFTSECASEILFNESLLRGNFTQGNFSWEDAARSVEVGTGSTVTFEPGAVTRTNGHAWVNEPTGALRAYMGDNQLAVAIENHPADSRVNLLENGIIQTLSQRMGTGGGNVPLLMTAFGISSQSSNAMQSDNPKSGFYEADVSKTIDVSAVNPTSCQGGIAVVSVQGSMIGRDEKNGPQGSGIRENFSFSLTGTDRHAVCYQDTISTLTTELAHRTGTQGQFGGQLVVEDNMEFYTTTQGCYPDIRVNISFTLTAKQHKDPPLVTENRHIVRRLTPTECALLQGFPSDWCDNLGTDNITEVDIALWMAIFETHRKIMGKSKKPKSINQLIKWIKNPYSDSAAYKMWGNGVALPCVIFVLSGIVSYTQNQPPISAL